MKKDADNFRDSAILDIIHILKQHGLTITIYEPALTGTAYQQRFEDCEVISDLNEFKKKNELIVANRWDKDIEDIREKVYSRDVFGYS